MGNVKIFRSTDFGAPQLYGNAGFLLPVLDACLVNGYGTQSVVQITHSGGTVTVQTASSHGLSSLSRQTIAGVANDTEYNGEYIITVTGANTFTYAKAGITINTGTGTITTKTAGAGWTKPFNGANLAVYRGGSGLRHFYRFDDTTTIAAKFRGYVGMSDVNTGTDPFPTVAQQAGSGLFWQKTNVADATTNRVWTIIADDRTVYMHIVYSSGGVSDYNSTCMMGFGDFDSYKGGDLYASFVSGATAASSYSQMTFGQLWTSISSVLSSSASCMYAPRSYSQVGSSVVLGKLGDYSKNTNTGLGCSGSLPYPHPVDGSLVMCPVTIAEGGASIATSVLRGIMRGLWTALHDRPLSHLDTFNGNADLSGKTFQNFNTNIGGTPIGQALMDISLTW